MQRLQKHILGLGLFFYASLGGASPWILNNPYPAKDANAAIYYASFNEQPRTLDPALSYSSNEYAFIGQIYEPLLEYDYLKRPYQLVPLIAAAMPTVTYLDAQKKPLATGDKAVYTVYTLTIKPGIFYQPHPALAKNSQGEYRYHHLPADFLERHNINQLSDFRYTGTRELIADDYIYQIKRLARPAMNSPIYGLMKTYILGFDTFGAQLPIQTMQYLDLRAYPLSGVNKIDNYHFQITLKKQYEQFLFWLAMPFFAPLPWEAEVFYAQKDMDEKNISLGWYPIGTGPFLLSENNPNRRMVLQKNPNFRAVYYPSVGSDSDKKAGFLDHAGQRLPLIDKAIFTLEKEALPRWNKFLQGYYDVSIISNDSFDKAIQISAEGLVQLSQAMQEKHLRLVRTEEPSIYYLGFNNRDPIVGGSSERARYLRQAISIAVNYEEYIALFYNGRGLAAQGPIPPGIFGYKGGALGTNPYTHVCQTTCQRRAITEAKQLMVKAGYPGGIDPKTGKPLLLHYDATVTASPQDKPMLDWMRKQFAKLGIELDIRATLYNRFQEKVRLGNVQMFSWGWNADYPDPENFLFQLYGPNGKVAHGGENAANYHNPRFDALFDAMKNRGNDETRQKMIDEMVALARFDAPWAFGMHTENFLLDQSWVSAVKPNTISLSTLKYIALDIPLRNKLRDAWNKPIFWPLGILLLLVLPLVLLSYFTYYRQEKSTAKRGDV